MRKVLISVGVCLVASAAFAQTRGTTGSRQGLVQAQCPVLGVPQPCDNSVIFKRGTFRFKRLKQPKLLFNQGVGRIRMLGVSPPQPFGLDAKISGLVSYGSDPDTDCPLANTQTLIDPLFTATMTCTTTVDGLFSNCKGLLQYPSPSAIPPATCTDATFIVEDIQAEVYEDGSVGNPAGLIARNGIAVIGRSPDCNSGGTNCP
jgi:hypothetical protein